MAVKTFFYDIGGVLLNITFQKAILKFSKATGKTPQQLREIFDHSDIPMRYEKGRISSMQFYGEICNAAGLTLGFEDFSKMFCEIFVENSKETRRLARLKRRCRILLVSNTNELHYEYVKSNFPAIRMADGAILSYKVGFRKPEPEIYLAALKAAGSKPEECVFVDDTRENIDAARSLGIRAILYREGRS